MLESARQSVRLAPVLAAGPHVPHAVCGLHGDPYRLNRFARGEPGKSLRATRRAPQKRRGASSPHSLWTAWGPLPIEIDSPGRPGQIVTRHSARAAEAAYGCPPPRTRRPMFPMQSVDCMGAPSHCIDLPGVNPGKSLRATGRAPQKRRMAVRPRGPAGPRLPCSLWTAWGPLPIA